MRTAWLSSHPAATSGYGTQTASMLRRLGAEFAPGEVVAAAFTYEGLDDVFDGVTVIPLGREIPSGRTTDGVRIASRLRQHRADVAITLYDPRALPGLAKALHPVQWVSWTPFDAMPVPPEDVAALAGCHCVVAVSRFGQAQLQAAGFSDVAYIPHGIEPAFVVQTDEVVRARRRQRIAPGCEHLTVIVASTWGSRYSNRKAWDQQLRAWAAFAQDKPGARLYCHSEPLAPFGINLIDLTNALGITDRVIFPLGLQSAHGVPVAEMVELYNVADVLLAASAGEGFGIPIIEAQACGVPVVVTDFTAMPELVRWGEAVKPLDVQWVPELAAWRAWPDVTGTAAALERLYGAWRAGGGMWPLEKRQQVSEAIHAEFGWNQVFTRGWMPLLKELGNGKSL